MVVTVELDPSQLDRAAHGVCQVGRSAKVFFDDGPSTLRLITDLILGPSAAHATATRR
jgi:hypothetical protein